MKWKITLCKIFSEADCIIRILKTDDWTVDKKHDIEEGDCVCYKLFSRNGDDAACSVEKENFE